MESKNAERWLGVNGEDGGTGDAVAQRARITDENARTTAGAAEGGRDDEGMSTEWKTPAISEKRLRSCGVSDRERAGTRSTSERMRVADTYLMLSLSFFLLLFAPFSSIHARSSPSFNSDSSASTIPALQ